MLMPEIIENNIDMQGADFIGLFVCPYCKGALQHYSGNTVDLAGQHESLACPVCDKVYAVDGFIPIFSEDFVEVAREGIAVDMDNAIAAYRGVTEADQKSTGRLIDADICHKNDVFLEIGCGIGSHLLALKNNGLQKVYGFDIVKRLVRIAREDYQLQNVFVANALYIPLPDGFADRCLLFNTIEHCSDPEKMLLEIHRVLAKNGTLYMDVPNARSMGDIIFRWGGMIVYGKTSHIQKFNWEKIVQLVEKVGFRILESKPQRGIYIDYPQLEGFPIVRRLIKFFFGNEVAGWELKLQKIV
jgi:ubiquinone/menaquinone biosynthesis C-methylase UbiE/uncharacterized protein YbaR (Trm112 family)